MILSLAERLIATYTESFLRDSTVAARAKLLALIIRLRIVQRIDPGHVAILSDELYAMHIKLRGTGVQDFIALSLYLGMAYSRKEEEGRQLLGEYVADFRRDRSPLPQTIQQALQ